MPATRSRCLWAGTRRGWSTAPSGICSTSTARRCSADGDPAAATYVVLTSAPCGGFQLAYERHGAGAQPVVLLHGWPGDHTDFRHVVPLLGDDVDVVVPDLRGFGRSDKHRVDPSQGYSAAAQARSVVAL